MKTIKLMISAALLLVVLLAQAGNVAAAPLLQDPITGTIESITPEADANGTVTVVIVLTDGQTFRVSVDTALSLGLLVPDPADPTKPLIDPATGLPDVDESKIGTDVTIDPATVVPEPEPEAAHPISTLLAVFFGEDASVIDDYHTDGFGFGVIAQALWMSKNLNEDASLAGLILDAKKSGDYSELASYLPEGTTVPTNWGQFKKAVSEKKNNLGSIVSGHADPDGDASQQSQNGNGNGQGGGNGYGNGNNNGKGNGKGHKKP